MERRLKIISADEDMATRASRRLVVGPAGVGKTTLLRTLDIKSTLFVDLEAGDLAVRDIDVDTFQPRTWEECRDLCVYLAGPNPALPATSCYSQAHYDAVVENMGGADGLKKYSTYFIDSITVAGRLCFASVRAAAGKPQRSRKKPARHLRADGSRDDRLADAAPAQPRQERVLCRHPRKPQGRVQYHVMAVAD